jgi:hypothetical protein
MAYVVVAPQNEGCAYCGATEAQGWAWINDRRFCHGDTLIASCYQEYMWGLEEGQSSDWIDWIDDEDPFEVMKNRKEEYK